MKTQIETNGASIFAVAEIIAAGILWGLIAIFVKPLAAAGLSPLHVTELRSLVAATGLFVLICIKNPALLRAAPIDLPLFAGSGILSIVMFNICYFATMESAPVSVAVILLYTSPFFVIILSRLFFKEKITGAKIIALFLAFAGCALSVGFRQSYVPMLAIITGLCSGLCYGLYTIFGAAALRKYSALTFTFYTFLFACIALPFAAADIWTIVAAAPETIGFAVALGVVSTIAPFLLYTHGLRNIQAGKAAVLAFSEPAAACVTGVVVFKENFSALNFLGLLLILVGICIISIDKNKAHVANSN